MVNGDQHRTGPKKKAPARRKKTAPPSGDTEMVQLLTADGERVSHPDYDIDLSDDDYRNLYRDMTIVRRLDSEGTALQRQGQLGIWASLLGQEAAQIGSGRALAPQDMVFPTYREHGVLWTRGIDPIMPFGLFRGVDLGGWDSRKYKFQMYTIVIGAQALHATGYAMGVTMDGKVGGDDGEAVIAYFGDGASSQGDVNESFVWASVYNAPVVFFCQNNQYAISEPVIRQAKAPLYKRADGFGFPGVRVDGNDVLATYAVTKAAVDNAREGNGPAFIEAFTYRMGAHTTTDDPTRYRDSGEVEEWKTRDPIARLRTFLKNEGLADGDFFDGIDAEADKHALDLRERVIAMPDPQPSAIFDHVYAEGSTLVDSERAEFNTYHASFEGSDH
ncbi:pyruvate dehydrogenase (acetyl-transferring) E1 component subunit alpha [Stackebrandtia soli]|uniref:pyruvate dehydrogenase (acetyl-transferring) E1 component subunit alpha n=1 Tax=Stackebrandtia soli TaxID=1892856 RepID=UPI0039E9D900